MEKGQADGISVRSMEMFQAFGFAEKVMRESVWINETTFWAPGADAHRSTASPGCRTCPTASPRCPMC